jgi:hypothetical protein
VAEGVAAGVAAGVAVTFAEEEDAAGGTAAGGVSVPASIASDCA